MRQEFETAFDAWLASESNRIRRDTSREIYRSIWSSFARDLPPDVSVLDITSDMVASYLETGASRLAKAEAHAGEDQAVEGGQKLSIRYQARVASLIERVMNHHAEATQAEVVGEPAVRVLMRKNPELANALKRETREEPAMDLLSEEEHERVKRYLVQRGQDDLEPDAVIKWSDVRDRTSMALQLGGGLSPSDVRELTMGKGTLTRSGLLFVPKNGKLFQRYTAVDRWAAELLEAWVQALRERGTPSGVDFVFPGESNQKVGSTGRPGQWSKAGQHKQTTKVLTSLGVQGSSFKLRHTWAMAKLREGVSEEDVAKYLGVKVGGEVMKRYREQREQMSEAD